MPVKPPRRLNSFKYHELVDDCLDFTEGTRFRAQPRSYVYTYPATTLRWLQWESERQRHRVQVTQKGIVLSGLVLNVFLLPQAISYSSFDYLFPTNFAQSFYLGFPLLLRLLLFFFNIW